MRAMGFIWQVLGLFLVLHLQEDPLQVESTTKPFGIESWYLHIENQYRS